MRDASVRRISSHLRSRRWAVPVSLNIMSPLVAMLDLCWIVLLGVSCGLLYETVASTVT